MIDNAREWCKNNTTPLLVPQNNWLTLSLPPQVTMMTCTHPITQMVTTPDSQHALCVFLENNIEMYHLSSKSLVKTFTGNFFFLVYDFARKSHFFHCGLTKCTDHF